MSSRIRFDASELRCYAILTVCMLFLGAVFSFMLAAFIQAVAFLPSADPMLSKVCSSMALGALLGFACLYAYNMDDRHRWYAVGFALFIYLAGSFLVLAWLYGPADGRMMSCIIGASAFGMSLLMFMVTRLESRKRAH